MNRAITVIHRLADQSGFDGGWFAEHGEVRLEMPFCTSRANAYRALDQELTRLARLAKLAPKKRRRLRG